MFLAYMCHGLCYSDMVVFFGCHVMVNDLSIRKGKKESSLLSFPHKEKERKKAVQLLDLQMMGSVND